MSGLLDAGGCLTAEGLAALAQAPVGQAPPEVATHIAGCTRCQDRLLAAGRAPGERREGPGKRPYQNLLVVGGILLLTIVMLGITLAMLAGR
jgi:hypothetical protein